MERKVMEKKVFKTCEKSLFSFKANFMAVQSQTFSESIQYR